MYENERWGNEDFFVFNTFEEGALIIFRLRPCGERWGVRAVSYGNGSTFQFALRNPLSGIIGLPRGRKRGIPLWWPSNVAPGETCRFTLHASQQINAECGKSFAVDVTAVWSNSVQWGLRLSSLLCISCLLLYMPWNLLRNRSANFLWLSNNQFSLD